MQSSELLGTRAVLAHSAYRADGVQGAFYSMCSSGLPRLPRCWLQSAGWTLCLTSVLQGKGETGSRWTARGLRAPHLTLPGNENPKQGDLEGPGWKVSWR